MYVGKTERERERVMKFEKVWENLSLVVFALIIVGQATVMVDVLLAQFVYLACNIIATARAFALARPMSEKVKDVGCLALTLGLIVIKMLPPNLIDNLF